MARKLPANYDNPIDDVILYPFERIDNQLYACGVTPNILTTVSVLFGGLAVYRLYQSRFLESAVYFFLYYVFDCYDGYFARKYNMVTDFGDKYDHYKDLIVVVLMSVLILTHPSISMPDKILVIVGAMFFGGLALYHFGCQEKYYNRPTETTKSLINMCKGDPLTQMKSTRYFTSSTLVLFVSVFLVMIHSKQS